MKRDSTEIFFGDINSKSPLRNYPTNKIVCYHIDEIWSSDLADFSDYKSSSNKRFRYIFVIIDNIKI